MGRVQHAWSFEDTCRMEDFIKAGKYWTTLIRYFPGRSAHSVEGKYYATLNKMDVVDPDPPSGMVVPVEDQDQKFMDAMSRAHTELRRQASTAPGTKSPRTMARP